MFVKNINLDNLKKKSFFNQVVKSIYLSDNKFNNNYFSKLIFRYSIWFICNLYISQSPLFCEEFHQQINFPKNETSVGYKIVHVVSPDYDVYLCEHQRAVSNELWPGFFRKGKEEFGQSFCSLVTCLFEPNDQSKFIFFIINLGTGWMTPKKGLQTP